MTGLVTTNALSIDVEDYFHASALDVAESQWESHEQRAAECTRRVIDLLAETGVKATFFILGWVAERNPALVRLIASDGHEIASHGYSHRLVYRQSREEFKEETRKAKRILEDIIGGPVHGYRAASFSIVEESRWALDVIADEGFAYDSSIFPVVHDRYGMPRAALEPHQLVTASGRTLIEIPPAVLSLGGLRIPVAGGGYFRLYPYAVTRWAMRRINRAKRPVVVYLHPWELDTGQPRLNIGLVTKFRHYVNIARVGERLRRLLRDFRFEPIGRIAQRYSDSVNETDAPRDGNHVSLSGESRQ